jgi:hypothetical protein
MVFITNRLRIDASQHFDVSFRVHSPLALTEWKDALVGQMLRNIFAMANWHCRSPRVSASLRAASRNTVQSEGGTGLQAEMKKTLESIAASNATASVSLPVRLRG